MDNNNQDQGQEYYYPGVFDMAASLINALPLIILKLTLSLTVGVVKILARAIQKIFIIGDDENDKI